MRTTPHFIYFVVGKSVPLLPQLSAEAGRTVGMVGSHRSVSCTFCEWATAGVSWFAEHLKISTLNWLFARNIMIRLITP